MKLKKKIKKIENALAKNKKISYDIHKSKKLKTPKIIKPGFSMEDLEKLNNYNPKHNTPSPDEIMKLRKEIDGLLKSPSKKADTCSQHSSTSSNDGKLIGSVEIYASDSTPVDYRVDTYGNIERFALEFFGTKGNIVFGYGGVDNPLKVVEAMYDEDDEVEDIMDSIVEDLDATADSRVCGVDVDEEEDDNVNSHSADFEAEDHIVLPKEQILSMTNGGHEIVFDNSVSITNPIEIGEHYEDTIVVNEDGNNIEPEENVKSKDDGGNKDV